MMAQAYPRYLFKGEQFLGEFEAMYRDGASKYFGA
jgi:hypothetical protein